MDKILTHLNVIADQVNPNGLSNKSDDSSSIVQNNIFDIINELAKEIGLGGEIKPDIRKKLNSLEEKIVPYLIQRDFKNLFIQNFKDSIDNSEEELDISNIEYKNKFLWCQIKDSPVYIRIGPLERDTKHKALIGFYVEFYRNRTYQKFRNRIRGWTKDYLRGAIFWYNSNDIINFSDYEMVKKKYLEYNNKNENSNQNDLVQKLVHHYKTWNLNGKNIEQIIDEYTIQS